VLRAADKLVRPIVDKFVQNKLQSRTLAALRDALLPRLLSGELRVREAERLVEERV
jgi:type I restriction enzyme S subunit